MTFCNLDKMFELEGAWSCGPPLEEGLEEEEEGEGVIDLMMMSIALKDVCVASIACA
jgi:hypothetical protein